MAKKTLIKLTQIENRFDVRTKLDDDRVIQLAEAYENGIELPPIELIKLDNEDDKYAYVDGRHRGAARAFLNLQDVPAIILSGDLNDQPLELYARALEANYGGSKPPTREDIIHTITRMLESGIDRTSIKERLNFLPQGAARAFIAHALSVISKRKIAKALDAVSEGVTVEQAAKSFKVKPETLKDIISGKKGKWGKNRSNEQHMGIETKAYISRQLRAANTGIAKKVEELLRLVNDGEISGKIAEECINAWAEHLRRTGYRVSDWEARLKSISNNIQKA